MRFRISNTKRLPTLGLTLLAAILFCPVSSMANITNTADTYNDSFESYTNGTWLVGGGGWYSEEEDALVVITTNYDAMFLGQRPLEGGITHTNVLQIFAGVTNLFNDLAGENPHKIWLDMMIQPRRWTEDDPPSVPDDAHLALYINSNGLITAYCRYIDGGTGQPSTNSTWLTMDHYPIGSNEWVRLTVMIWFQADFGPGEYFQMILNNSAPVRHIFGVGMPTGDFDEMHFAETNGSWFLCTGNGTTKKLNSVAFTGTGYLDDFVVTNALPSLLDPRTVLVEADTGGVPAPIGAVAVRDGGSAAFAIDEAVGYNVTNVAWGRVSDNNTTYWTNSVLYATNYLGWTNSYTFPVVNTNFVLYVFAEPELRTLQIVNNGLFGTPSPAVGFYTNDYNTTTNCTIGSFVPLNTATSRHYCTWSRTWSDQSASGYGSTNSVFKLLGTNTSDITVLTWDWYRQHWLNTEKIGPVGFMQSDAGVTPGDSWQRQGSTPTVTATGYGNWYFTNWWGTTNGCTITGNQIDVPMTGPRTNIAAEFAYAPIATNWTLVINSDYGIPTPPVGTNTGGAYADGNLVVALVAASPVDLGGGTSAVCIGWSASGHLPSSGIDTSVTFMITSDTTITWNWTLQGPAYGPRGTPGTWFTKYGITNFAEWAYAETNDADGDGMLNWEEYVTGTDPTNSASVFGVIEQYYAAASNRITWYGTTNSGVTNAFGVWRATNLVVASPWQLIQTNDLTRNATGTNIWWDTTPPASNLPVFYRPMTIWTNWPD